MNVANNFPIFSANNRIGTKNIFKSIFCCFKTSQGPSHSKRSSAPKKSKDKKSSHNNGTQFNDLNTGNSAQSNLTNLQNLSINNTESNNDKNFNDTNVDNNNIDDNNSRNPQKHNGCFNNNNDSNNNGTSLYNNQPNYFQNGNDNINLNNIEKPLLEPLKNGSGDKKCLIIDLDETLVHSSFKVSFFQLKT